MVRLAMGARIEVSPTGETGSNIFACIWHMLDKGVIGTAVQIEIEMYGSTHVTSSFLMM